MAMPGLDLRRQWRFTKRALLLVVAVMGATVVSGDASLRAATGLPSTFAGGFFVFMVGSVVLATAVGWAAPRIWMNSTDSERDLQLKLTGWLNLVGWSYLVYLLASAPCSS